MIITLLRKPLEGSVADNTLKHECGAINIDATRISTDDRIVRGANPHNKNPYSNEIVWSGSSTPKIEYSLHNEGRWPANFILIHLEGCELKGTKKVKSDGHWTQKANIGKFYEGGWSHQEIDEGNKMSDEDGKEEVADWACVDGCPVRELDRQSGHLKSGEMKADSYQMWGVNGIYGECKEHPATYYGDEGGASRFFKQFKGGQ